MSHAFSLPDHLPIPQDDGACNHLAGKPLPSLLLESTDGDRIDVSSFSGVTVVYCYPLSGRPGVSLPENWDQIPGARGCTPQSCAYRKEFSILFFLRIETL